MKKIEKVREFSGPDSVETQILPQGYKTFFVLSSVEHEILNAHKYKNIKKYGLLTLS